MTTGADWVDQARRLLDAFVAGSAATPAPSPAAGESAHRADCSWCPLCQAAAVVRGERPEVTAALADVLTATATALRTFAESARPAEPSPPASTDDGPEAEPPPAVQRIEIA
jgi:hypothetical protein